MKIAIYANIASGGVRRSIFEIAKQLRSHNHLVHFYSTKTQNPLLDFSDVSDEMFFVDYHESGPIAGRVPILRRYIDLLRLKRDLNSLLEQERHLSENITNRNYDLVFVNGENILLKWGGVFMHPPMLRFLATSSIYYCYEPVIRYYFENQPTRNDEREIEKPLQRLRNVWYRPAEVKRRSMLVEEDRKNLSAAPNIVTSSYYNSETIARFYGRSSRVLYLGVDTAWFCPSSECLDGDYILSVGDIDISKGHALIVDAIGLLPEKSRPRLIIVGPKAHTGEAAYIKNLAGQKGVNLDIRVGVTEIELRDLYRRAIAFVFTPYLEPFGLAPLESMACGTPVVAVKEAGPRETVVHNVTGKLVQRDRQEVADCLGELISDTQLRKKMGKQARENVVSKWTWERTYAELIKIADNPGRLQF